jgi:hypothetical protein
MPSKLPDFSVMEYAKHRHHNVGEVEPYYRYIYSKIAHKITNKTRNNNLKNMIAKETLNYIKERKSGMPMQAVIIPKINNKKSNRSNKATRKQNAKVVSVKRNATMKQIPTYGYVESKGANFNDPYYKANATGYIPALNYMTNNNL